MFLNYRSRFVGMILLGCLLVVLAGLQYHWLNEISQAEIQQTRRQLEAAINHLTCQFDLEIARATMSFQPHPGRSPAPKLAIEEAWRDWQRGAHAQLLRSVVLLDGSGGGDIPFHPPPAGRSVSGGISMSVPGLLTIHGNPVVIQPTISIPGPFERPSEFREPRISWVMLTFNRDYLLRELLPGLVQQNIASVAQTEYAVRIHSDGHDETISASGAAATGTAWRTADVTAPLFRGGLDCSSETPFPPAGSPISVGMSGMVRMSGPRPGPYVTAMSGPGLMGLPGTAAVEPLPDTSSWRLLVRHRSGSLEQAFADFRRRNLLASTGVLLILATSIAALTLSAERARILAKAQTEMAIGLSHELKTPLTALRIAAANLQSGAVSTKEQASRYGDIIDEQSRRLLALVENTLRYARAQPSVTDALRLSVEPEEIVRAALQNRAVELDQAGMRVAVTGGKLPSICADAALLTHCIENLIDNAVKYAARGEYLGIRTEFLERARQSVVRFTVEDRGLGIARQDLPHIFEPFYRGVSARSSRSEGIGVGLAFVKRVIEAHGGRVEARSASDGATFVLEIPA